MLCLVLSKYQENCMSKVIKKDTNALRATHTGKLILGDIKIPCFVLTNGTRVISQRGMFGVLGKSPNTTSRIADLQKIDIESPQNPASKKIAAINSQIYVPAFLSAFNLESLVLQRFAGNRMRDLVPIEFLSKGSAVFGFKAELLVDVCDIWLEARQLDLLEDRQQHIALRCELLMRNLARIGIAALVDEATGYQEVRDRDALQKLLDRYLREDLMRWVKTFPDGLYEEWYRLLRWEHLDPIRQRPGILGTYTKRLVYDKLLPGLTEALHNKRGEESHRLHQYLSDDAGRKHLERHLIVLESLAHPAQSWEDYEDLVHRVVPNPKL